MKNLRNAIASACLAASLFFPVKNFSEQKTVFDETYPVEMTYEYGDRITENFRIKASLDSEINTLYLATFTQDYNRNNWAGDKKKSLPVPNRHTRINYNFSKIILLRPSRIKIDDLEQRAYTVPKYRWSSALEPYETSEIAQLTIEAGDTIISKLFSGIPFLNKLYDKFLKDSEEKEEKYYDKIFEKIDENYVRTRISPYMPKDLIGQTETAREYTIKFDTGNTQDLIPMYIWLRIDLGDSSSAPYGSPPNKSGKLENVLIRFNLNEDKIKREELYNYFFHEDELKHLNIANRYIEGTKSNPAIITLTNLEQYEGESYQEDKILRIGKGEYILQEIGDSVEKDLSFEIKQFETSKDRENFIKEQREEIRYPYFFKESIFSFVSKPTIGDILNPLERFNEEQTSIYYDLILDYANRTGMQIVLSENERESEELLKAIKGYQINSEEK
jgi:hypothetical protein